MNSDTELRLLAGYPIDIDIGKVHQSIIKDIIDMGESEYNQYLGILLYDTSLIEFTKADLDNIGLDSFTTYDFLVSQCIQSSESKDVVLSSLEFFFKEKVGFVDFGMKSIFHLGKLSDGRFITRDNYNLFKKTIIKSNYLKELEEEENLVFANERARQMYLDIKRAEKNRPTTKTQVNLHSILSAIMWRTNKPISEILNMTVYQLYDGYHRLFLIDDCLNTAQGIYHGTIDGEKIKPDKLNWAKIIKFEN